MHSVWNDMSQAAICVRWPGRALSQGESWYIFENTFVVFCRSGLTYSFIAASESRSAAFVLKNTGTQVRQETLAAKWWKRQRLDPSPVKTVKNHQTHIKSHTTKPPTSQTQIWFINLKKRHQKHNQLRTDPLTNQRLLVQSQTIT